MFNFSNSETAFNFLVGAAILKVTIHDANQLINWIGEVAKDRILLNLTSSRHFVVNSRIQRKSRTEFLLQISFSEKDRSKEKIIHDAMILATIPVWQLMSRGWESQFTCNLNSVIEAANALDCCLSTEMIEMYYSSTCQAAFG